MNASWERYRSLTVALLATLMTAGMLYVISGTTFLRNKALPDSSTTTKVEDTQNIEDVTEEEDQDQVTEIKKETEDEEVDKDSINKQIEEYDTQARGLFKEKKHIEAAAVFTKAIELIDNISNNNQKQFQRQLLSLKNNRAAMYEKAGMLELALEDCEGILSLDVGHSKARTRKLRILESEKRYQEALVEICALQLRFMHDNRDKIRLGIQVPPPVSQEKINEVVSYILPTEVDRIFAKNNENLSKSLPSTYTILQLLKSFNNYNTWMGQAARDGSAPLLTQKIQDAELKALWLLKRGIRHAYDLKFNDMAEDILKALALVQADSKEKEGLEATDNYLTLLEWAGMCRHLKNDLEGALECYKLCNELSHDNVSIIVKYAGVLMDSTKYDEALKLFSNALEINPAATDALLHRANLYLVQQNAALAKKDLQKCIQLRPDNSLFARTRLATIHISNNDIESARSTLEQCDDECSEVHSYRGEIHFALGEFDDAKQEFQLAMKYDTTNPTPYVNMALTLMNTLQMTNPHVPPDMSEITSLLTKAIEIDPQFHLAYVHLGQLKLSMAKDLIEAKEVVKLYDEAMSYCRSKDEMKDVCNMRILTVAQIDAATMLGMTTLS